MNPHPPAIPLHDRLASYFWSDGVLRSRSVSNVVRWAMLDVPAPPARLVADWQREISQRLVLEPGDVEELPLARARMRWPDYGRCVQSVSDWTGALGLPGLLASGNVALMACRGARYHHDGADHGAAAFCNLFLSEDRGLDLHFPSTDHRIALTRGTVVLFDTAQPHAVITRGSKHFEPTNFPDDQDRHQVFLTWELPVEDAGLGHALGIDLDIDPSAALQMTVEQVWRQGAPAQVCAACGQWNTQPPCVGCTAATVPPGAA